MLRRFTAFWRLIRGARDNPLVLYGSPARRGWIPRLFFDMVMLVFFGGLGTLVVALIVPGALQYQLDEEVRIFAWFAAPFFIPVAFLYMAPRWRSEEKSTSLYMTALPGDEAAFGVLFWPLLLLLMYICGLGMGYLGYMMLTEDFTGYIIYRWKTGWYLGPLAFRAVDRLTELLILMFCHLMLMLRMAHQWLDEPRNVFRPLIRSPLAAGFATGGLALYSTFSMHVVFPYRYPNSGRSIDYVDAVFHLLGLIAIIGLILWIPVWLIVNGSRGRIYALAEPQGYFRASSHGLSKSLRYLPREMKRLGPGFWRSWSRGLPYDLLVAGLTLGVAWILAIVPAWDLDMDKEARPVFWVILLSGLAGTVNVAVKRIFRKHNGLAIRTGRSVGCLWLHTLPLASFLTVGVLLPFLPDFLEKVWPPDYAWIIGAVALLVFIPVVILTFSLPGLAFQLNAHLSLRSTLVVGGIQVTLLVILVILLAQGDGEAFGLFILLYFLGHTLAFEPAFQLLHQRVDGRYPVGSLTSEVEPTDPDVIVPDGYFKL